MISNINTRFQLTVNLLASEVSLHLTQGGGGVASEVGVAMAGDFAGTARVSSGSVAFEVDASGSHSIAEYQRDSFVSEAQGFRANSSSLAEGQIVALRRNETWVATTMVSSLEPAAVRDYVVSAEISAAGGSEGDVVCVPSFSARPLSITELTPTSTKIVMDGLYAGLLTGSLVVIDHPELLALTTLADSYVDVVEVGNNVQASATVILIEGDFGLLQNYLTSLKIWFNPVPAARLVRLPATQVTYDQILATTNAPPDAIILDATDTVITPGYQNAIPPIRVLRNLAKATRGRTVRDEVIGSGDASKSFQSFQLAKSPLTYLPDPSAPKGLRNTLEVFVDGQKWRQAPSFYGAKPSDAIYVVRHDEDHETFVVFGDGELGRRLPTGVDNVVATYRYGVGGNVPANSITTLEKPIKGIRKIFNPLPATGGKEPPTREQLRREAPLSTLVLGRCISLLLVSHPRRIRRLHIDRPARFLRRPTNFPSPPHCAAAPSKLKYNQSQVSAPSSPSDSAPANSPNGGTSPRRSSPSAPRVLNDPNRPEFGTVRVRAMVAV